jgi:hypothetical protein
MILQAGFATALLEVGLDMLHVVSANEKSVPFTPTLSPILAGNVEV